MAGFKYKKFSFTGGDTNFPSGTSTADIRTKEESIVKGFADALIAMNIGWQCDTDRDPNATTSSFTNVPKYSSSEFAPGLFLKNTTSGCKLFIAYVDDSSGMALYDSDGTTKILPNTSTDYFLTWYDPYYSNVYCLGFIMSMIPAGSSNSFGTTFKASEFLPSDATRLYSSAHHVYSSANSTPTIITRVSNGIARTVCVWGNAYCVGYGCGDESQTNNNFSYAVGRILGDLGNPTVDTTNQAKYGVLSFAAAISAPNEYYFDGNNRFWLDSSQAIIGYSYFNIFGKKWSESLSGSGISINFSASPGRNTILPTWGFSICKSDGTWVKGTSYQFVTPSCDGYKFVNKYVQDLTSNNRMWAPIEMWLYSNDPQNNNIANGSGFKGYLDTNLFRCSVPFNEGTAMDNGNFVCTGIGCLTLGWDPTNESW